MWLPSMYPVEFARHCLYCSGGRESELLSEKLQVYANITLFRD